MGRVMVFCLSPVDFKVPSFPFFKSVPFLTLCLLCGIPWLFILPLLCMLLLLSPALPLLVGGETHPPVLYSASPCLPPWHAYSSPKQRGWSGDTTMLHFLLLFCLVVQAFCCPAWKDLLLCQWTSPAPHWSYALYSTRCVVTVWLDLNHSITIRSPFKLWGNGRKLRFFFFSFCLLIFINTVSWGNFRSTIDAWSWLHCSSSFLLCSQHLF